MRVEVEKRETRREKLRQVKLGHGNRGKREKNATINCQIVMVI